MRFTRQAWLAGVVVAVLALTGKDARALSLSDSNLVDLLRTSEAIVVGEVTTLTDGFGDDGLPYTEVTLEISETIQGNISGTFSFHQFGLLAPQPTADGTMLRLSQVLGMPKYEEGQDVVLFLGPPAALTGLRTTVGLGQGKFVAGTGRIESELSNEGLFENVSLEPGLTTENENRMLATEKGAVNPDAFLGFIRRAVSNRWIANGLMWRTDEGRPGPRPGLPRPPAVRPPVKKPLQTTPKTIEPISDGGVQ